MEHYFKNQSLPHDVQMFHKNVDFSAFGITSSEP